METGINALPSGSAPIAQLPLVLIAGYLGAGKTSLVNHLLRQAAGRRIAVLVNDFGSVNIDADLIASTAEQAGMTGVLSLTGGCLCCSFGDDLVGTLGQLAARQPPLDVCLVELSGVALPASVARTARLAPAARVVASLVLADAEHIQRQAGDAYVGDTVRQQLQQADWLLLNKADLVNAQQLQDCASWLQAAAPQAHTWSGSATAVPPELIFGWQTEALQAVADGGAEAGAESAVSGFAPRAWSPVGAAEHRAAALFESRSYTLAPGVALHALAARLAAADSGVLRAKGLLDGQLLQVAGGRWSLESGYPTNQPSVLVLIGLHGRWQPDRLMAPWLIAASAAAADARHLPSP